MWQFISRVILTYRVYLILLVFLCTLFFGYQAQYAQLSYDFSSAVPKDDPEYILYDSFKSLFGDDGTILAIGAKDEEVYQLDNFKALKSFCDSIKTLKGVNQVLAFPHIHYLAKDTVHKKFEAKKIFDPIPTRQSHLDSLLDFARKQLFYKDLLYNSENGATVILVAIDKEVLETSYRQELIGNIQTMGGEYEKKTKIELHYAGLPFIRAMMAGKVGAELQILLILSGLATALILLFFFRSFTSVIVPLLIIATAVVWCVGILTLLGYKITILIGLLPPVLIVIGIPNCVYLLNKYHQEYRYKQDKMKALDYIIQRIGVVTFLTNMTTAIGFAVFILMDNQNLKQFGIVASLSIASMFLVSIILLPSIYSFLPPPSKSQLRHLDRKSLSHLLNFFYQMVFYRRRMVYAVVLVLTLLSIIGFTQMKTLSFMLDNIPENSKPKRDLAFFEEHFKGLMPLEIMVDTRKQKGALRLSNLQQVDKFETLLAESDLISKPLSINGLVKASRQAFYNNQSDFYELPNRRDQPFIFRYLQDGQDSTSNQLLKALVDSTGQKIRISLKVADVGSIKLDSLINQFVQPKVEEAFDEKRVDVAITGITRIFLKGNDYLVTSIRNSLLLAIALISILMAFLFSSFRIILITIITNILPLLITAGLMGFWGISLKPSTALIFSIAFGIAIDDSIHFLARFRQAINLDRQSVSDAIAVSLKETGTGMVYTSIILFCGFIVFLYSDFDGTKALGYLTATTLFCAMFGNLLLLPALLMDFEKSPKSNSKSGDKTKDNGLSSNGSDLNHADNGLGKEFKLGNQSEG